MAQSVLPSQINYAEQLPSLMAGVQNLTQVLNPVNGSKFTSDGAQIIIDFPSRGFVDTKSIYFSYNMAIVQGATTPSVVRCPLYAPFSRVDLYINNSLIESINDYNLIACLWTELYLGPNEKAAVQSAFGYSNTDGAITKYDSKVLTTAATTSYKVSGPLVCSMLSSMDKFLPAFACGQVRLVFTLDALNNYTSFTATRPTSFELSNFQVTYDLIDFGAEVEQAVLSMPQVVIKSSGYINQSVTVPVGTSGNQSFVFNTRLASIRNAVLSSSCAADAVFVNGKFDSPNLAGGATATFTAGTPSSFSLNIGGQIYPQAGPLSTTNQSAILMELRKATGSLYDWSKSMSINNLEFAYIETGRNTANATDLTTALEPAKFYVAFDLNKINSASNAMLNGTSSQNSPVVAQINFAAATTLAKSLNLTSQYDSILTIDTRTKQISTLM
jgi:hypothetical protein